ncbi:MAG: hypothetical protein AB7E79_09660 [Rhodospirillaceae bacterium]
MNSAEIIRFPGSPALDVRAAARRPRKRQQLPAIAAALATLNDAGQAAERARRDKDRAAGVEFDAETVALRALEAIAATPAATAAELAAKLEALFVRLAPLAGDRGPLPPLIASLRADAERLLR